MLRAIPLVMLLLAYTFTVVSCEDTIENRIIDFLNLCNQSDMEFPKVVNNSAYLYTNDSTAENLSTLVEDFINDLIELGENYTESIFNLTVPFHLFTPDNRHEGYDLELSEESLNNSTFNPSLDTKFIIHGYSSVLPNTSAYLALKDVLLGYDDYNVIVVNWTRYNQFPYTFASVNAAFVGFEIGKLIQLLTDSANITSKSVHLIGHSLGAQTAAFAGKVFKNIGRITGLDAAGPIFQGLPKFLRLSELDADFVDGIHTNDAFNPFEGYGTVWQYGHMDFFPNGGSKQPSCNNGDPSVDTDNITRPITDFLDTNTCSHDRALYLFLYSINSCRFDSVPCSSYEDFENGKCPPEEAQVVPMGLFAEPVTADLYYTTFYLDTTGMPPFC